MTHPVHRNGNEEHWQQRLTAAPPSISLPMNSAFDLCRIPLWTYTDSRGDLSVVTSKEFTSGFKRVFFVYGSSASVIRGNHSHLECAQLLIAVHGQTRVYIESPKRDFTCVELDSPRFGLFIPARYWCAQYSRSEDSVLTVVASDPYDETDYIRSYRDWEATIRMQ
jgi:hypothetical protein